MPDIVILPSAREIDELRRLLRKYRKDEAEDYEIEDFVTMLVGKTYRLTKSIVKLTED
jgi:hypothetical protein